MIRPFLVYPGGKTKAVPLMLGIVPEDEPIVSPFIGAGCVELNLADRGQRVYGYDKWEALANFWQVLLDQPYKLAAAISEIPVGIVRYRQALREFDKVWLHPPVKRAAMFYDIAQSAYGGKFTNRRPVKQRSTVLRTRMQQRMMNLRVPSLTVENLEYQDSLDRHPDLFAYIDPPYLLPKGRDTYYGRDGEYHSDFDHEAFAKYMSRRRRWVMHYNDTPVIRKLYRDFDIYNLNDPALGWRRSLGEKGLGGILEEEILIMG